MTASGNRPTSVKKAKTSSQTIFYTLNTRSTLATRVYTRARTAVPQTGSSGQRGGGGGRVMEVK